MKTKTCLLCGEPPPPPTTIEWERIPKEVAYGQRAIVLVDGKPEPAWRGELGWRRAGVLGAPGMIHPNPVWWEKKS